MKALSICNPYADYIRMGHKRIETRSWKTNYRGEILLHCSLRKMKTPYGMPIADDSIRGKTFATARLIDCVEITDEFKKNLTDTELRSGFYDNGRYAWILDDVKVIEPKSIKGSLGLFNVDEERK